MVEKIFELTLETFKRLENLKFDMDVDNYYTQDYDLRDEYNPSTWDAVFSYLLDRHKFIEDLQQDKVTGLRLEAV